MGELASVAPELDPLSDMPEGQVERRLAKLLDELTGVRFAARGRQLIVDCKAHVRLPALMVQRPGQSVTY